MRPPVLPLAPDPHARPGLSVTAGSAGLVIRDLRKSYRRRPVIRDVSMTLNRGEVVALLGPNGSGKTTCFYAIAGLVSPEGGDFSIKLEDQVLVTETGFENLTRYPFDIALT